MANSNDHGCNTVWLVNIDSEFRIALWSHVIYEALTLLGGFVSDTWTTDTSEYVSHTLDTS